MIEINSLEQFRDEIKSGKVIVDFNADWCYFCRVMEPILEETAENNKDLKILSVNVDKNPDISSEYSIQALPTFKKFEDGKEIETKVGGMEEEDFQEFVK